MSKALFFSLPLRGHVNPSLSLVRALVSRGDDVVYYATEPFAAEITLAGARYQAYRDPYLADLSQLPSQTHELSSLLMRAVERVLETELTGVRAERPDYVIADSVAPWGQWIGKILGVPIVTSVSTFAFNRHVMAFGLAHGVRPKSARLLFSKIRHIAKAFLLRRRLCRAHGVAGPGVMESVMGRSDLNIVYTSRLFQPCAETFDTRYQFVGPMTTRVEEETYPWENLRQSDVIYVSLGTLFNDDVSFYRNCFDAFAGQDVQVIMSIGTRVTKEDLGGAPPNFTIATRVPQLAVLQRVKAFVTHGGMNSVSESLAFGVPMVVVPQMGEQAIVARQVEHVGAGVCLTKEQVTPEKLRESVRQLLVDERFRRQAAVIRQSFLEAGGAARAADAVLAFTRQARSS